MSDGTKLVAVIGDEDTVTGFILAGIGHRTAEGSNFLVVNSNTPISVIESTFRTLTTRDDIAILLITQQIAEEIRHLLTAYDKTIPTILEIPSKDAPYDPAKDYIMKRVNLMLGETP
uniref:H or Na translocating Ftype putative n=1 Tax=Albugo laibachii Nc14 TaxID=890382 RepID=F0WGT6_9STRA|nr:H or Na translocating Ftype putative [Albugo laibachii Nc14]|eukprot:CCA20450.1 H or Na translocating Ftype putative [Albugo laibachii Nc14]